MTKILAVVGFVTAGVLFAFRRDWGRAAFSFSVALFVAPF
jgi:hypothetical protein